MTREETLENAIKALRQWSEGEAATGVVIAAVTELLNTKPPPRRQKLSWSG